MHRKFFIKSTLVLVISYFMLVGVLYSHQVNSTSATRTFPVTPGCIQGIKNINATSQCRSGNLMTGFRHARFECYGGAGGQLYSRSCVSYDSFKTAASESCLQMSACNVISTTTPTLPPPTEEVTPTGVRRLTPTPCVMPTAPLCENGTLLESDQAQTPGVCGPRFICVVNRESTPTPEVME